MSMSMPNAQGARQARTDLQRAITKNVRVLQAVSDLTRADLAKVLGISVDGINHKFTGRAKWSLDDIVTLAELGGPAWPVGRFCAEPEGSPVAKTGYWTGRFHRSIRRTRRDQITAPDAPHLKPVPAAA